MGRTALCFIREVVFVSIFLILGTLATAQAQSFTVSGRVTDPPSGTGVGIPGVTLVMTLNGSTQTSTQTDSAGNFSFAAIAAGSNYDVTPSKPNFTFTPSSQGGFNIQADRTLFFTGALTTSAVVQFNAANSSASESNSAITINVIRSGDTSGISTVDYTTSDTAGANPCSMVNNVASSRCDYITTLGTLSFAANETLKTISIPIIDDVYAEGNENFTITLTNASGATLGTQTTATLTINDNDSVNGTSNPIDVAGFFVRQHYIDFFSREPDTSGLNFWTNEITQCGADAACTDLKRINVSAAFFLSIEFQETGYLVYRMYKSGFGNLTGGAPVPVRFNEFLRDTQQIGQGVQVGVGNWQAQLEANKQTFALAFVQRVQFLNAFPSSRTAEEFVTQLDTNAGGVLSADEHANLVGVLGSSPSDVTRRASVLRSVSEDTDLKNAEFNKAFVLMQYFGYLRRNPNDAPDSDFSGYNFWLGKLNQFGGNFVNAEMVKAFITSIEYRRRFAP
jgi:hypothetical protein